MGSVALGQNLNADIEKGVFDRFRSLPIARSAPLVGAVLADFVRYLILCVVFVGFGYVIGFRIDDQPAARSLAALALAIAFALCFCWISVWVGMMARTSGAVQGIMFLLVLAAVLRQQHVRPDRHDAGLAAGVRQGQPDHATWSASVRGLMLGGPVADAPALDAASGWPACWRCSSRWRCGPTAAASDRRPEPGPRPGPAAATRLPGRGPCRARSGAANSSAPECRAQQLP